MVDQMFSSEMTVDIVIFIFLTLEALIIILIFNTY